jgi:hypothetical protein
MADLISKLTGEQALQVVARLWRRGGKIREAVLAEATDVLTAIDVDATADEVFSALDSLDVTDCWDRSGESRDGYTSPDEAAAEMIDDELRPFLEQVDRYHEMGMPEQEATYCRGVLFGLYRYEHESKSEFSDWSVDIPVEYGGRLLGMWRKRNRGGNEGRAMDEFILRCCPKWAGHMKSKPG